MSELVLDSTCSKKRNFPKNATVRMDISPEAKPDLIASACLLPFRSGVFQQIYCDPPHRIGRRFGMDKSGRNITDYYTRFSFWKNRREWLSFMFHSGKEFHRCLTDSGELIYKLPDGTRSKNTMIDRGDLKFLSNFKIINDDVIESQGFFAKSNIKNGKSKSYIHYIKMIKEKETKKE